MHSVWSYHAIMWLLGVLVCFWEDWGKKFFQLSNSVNFIPYDKTAKYYAHGTRYR